jgi:ATP adenylyltransferase
LEIIVLQQENLWAPWRTKYIQGLSKPEGCFICDYLKTPDSDGDNLVLWRTEKSVVVLNRFPYNNGHLLIAPVRHIAGLEQADETELLEITKLIRETQKALSLAVQPHGFNIGMNFGRCAGAGLPEHMHVHVVPRWDGDTNFMSVCGDTKVISQSLKELFEELKRVSSENNLPGL